MRIDILTIFPHIFDSYFKESLMARAEKKRILDVHIHNLRDYSQDRHKKVDDRPFGGGPGMVLGVLAIFRAVEAIKKLSKKKGTKRRVVLFSTRGKALDAKTAKRLSRFDQLILICGRYEGVDERVAEHIADEEISIGNYVLSGGELPALVLAEAVARFLPGFLGKGESLEEIKGSYPVYTRPAKFRTWSVPKVLTEGDHKKIRAWRERKR